LSHLLGNIGSLLFSASRPSAANAFIGRVTPSYLKKTSGHSQNNAAAAFFIAPRGYHSVLQI
jgi:hypothetical protein